MNALMPRWSTSALAIATIALSGCNDDLPAYGEVVLVVDTDLEVPRLVDRLRVDVYTADGAWFESRDLRVPNPQDWPVSFSVLAPTEAPASEVLVRLRAYPEGRVRPYTGERYRGYTPYAEPFAPASVAEMCAAPPELVLGKTVTVRRSDTLFTHVEGGECGAPPPPMQPAATETGASAVRVEIPERGAYRFAVVDTYPKPPFGKTHTVLELRSACDDPESWIACASGSTPVGPYDPASFKHAELLIGDLAPGTYYLVTAGAYLPVAADVTIAAARADEWAQIEPPPPSIEPEPVPYDLDGDPASTPPEEPLPETSVDRLVGLRLEYGFVRTTSVVLRGECSGTMADLAGAQSCVDREGIVEPVTFEIGEAFDATTPLPTSEQGSFGLTEPCPPEASSDVVCIPGGPSLLGFAEGNGLAEFATTPERLTVLEPFWIDRYEVTVARYRAAIGGGFAPNAIDFPVVGPHPAFPSVGGWPGCTWVQEPKDRENHPVNCITWKGAREFCQFVGGDLPSEAQWEHVVQTAGRNADTIYPWGNDPPRCNCESVAPPCHVAALASGRGGQTVTGDEGVAQACQEQGLVPVDEFDQPMPGPVDAFMGPTGDVSAGLGIVGLAGNVNEWVRDSSYPYDYPCWRGSAIHGRACDEVNAPVRMVRGGFVGSALSSATSRRPEYPIHVPAPKTFTGFRCAYLEPPR